MKTLAPATMFYWGDWLRDPALRSCSLAARGMWIDLLAHAHFSPDRGYLRHSTGIPISPDQIARLVGTTPADATTLLQELLDAGVCSRAEDGAIYSRRMIREAHVSEVRAEAGRKSTLAKQTANKPPTKPQQSPEQTPQSSYAVAFADTPHTPRGGEYTNTPYPHPETNEEQQEETHPPDQADQADPSDPPSHPGRGAGGESKGRDPQNPPDDFDPSTWRQACTLADLVEASGPSEGVGGAQRAIAFACLLNTWHGRSNRPQFDHVRSALQIAPELAHHSIPVNGIMAALRTYPDGAYPGTGGIKDADPKRPSRIEQLVKITQTTSIPRSPPTPAGRLPQGEGGQPTVQGFKRFSNPLPFERTSA